jgi:hypothetical protein
MLKSAVAQKRYETVNRSIVAYHQSSFVKHFIAMGSSSSKHSFLDCTNDYELVIKSSKELEWLLETHFGARGLGLQERISNARGLPSELESDLRFLATVRNKLVHDRLYTKIDGRADFIKIFKRSALKLEDLAKPKDPKGSSCILL